ncbi:sacsin N-terminal ATP-binding-like domain-containing protein [Nocardia camponoti]|uniref:ATP-binding protein n=1 Tax=Nocardia camponoti TaxID=1616106 RepID=A0A917VAT4_9NOCA|nr:ATP-binding protein [Nocardia camponoti]GGK58567.1 hypothetical protein GCM10011591_33470 [Nocardia camponoti]
MLAAWRDSPTRLREDSATEADLVAAGYRDRLLTELAQNAADAATKAGVAGELMVWLDGNQLHVANTGAPLELSGVHALAALRASAKTSADQVGEFGVGFTAVRTVGDEIEVRSTTGSIRFSDSGTRKALSESAINATEQPPVLRLVWPTENAPVEGTATEVVIDLRPGVDKAALLTTMRSDAPDLLLELPALRRISIDGAEFTSATTTPTFSRATDKDPFTSEQDAYLSAAAALGASPEPAAPLASVVAASAEPDQQAPDPSAPLDPSAVALHTPVPSEGNLFDPVATSSSAQQEPVDVGSERGSTGQTAKEAAQDPHDDARPNTTSATESDSALSEFTITYPDGSTKRWWQYSAPNARWLLPLKNGRPVAAPHDVLRAPTRSDEELSLPALLIADRIPMQPDRRRILPGANLPALADGYVDFARALPPRDRLTLVPTPGFARSEVDATLREAIIAELRTSDWLPVQPAAAEPHPSTIDQPGQPASAEPHPSTADQPGEESLAPFGPKGAGTATAIPTRATLFPALTPDLARVANFIDALVIPELSTRAAREKLTTLGVANLTPATLVDNATGLDRDPTWWRDFYSALAPFATDTRAADELGALPVPLADGRLVTGPRTVVLDDQLTVAAPVHWARLVHPDAAHPLLAQLGARSATADDLLNDPALRDLIEDDPADEDTIDAVLQLAPFATHIPAWLSELELPDETGESRPIDELLLPNAPLKQVLTPDSPFGTVDQAFVDAYGEAPLRAIGVGWGFQLVTEADPLGPDHNLDDEQSWWATLESEPAELNAVRDLDLVDEDNWPIALRHLLDDPRTRPLLADPTGYTAWWLSRNAVIDGLPIGRYRHPADTEFAGLLPVFDSADADALKHLLVDSSEITPALAEELLDALADPANTPTPQVVAQTHARLAKAVATGELDPTDIDPPHQVRTLNGAVNESAMVLDNPSLGLVLPHDRVVVTDSHPAELAELLDLPLASHQVRAEVVTQGRETTWAEEPLGILWRQLWSPTDTNQALYIHDEKLEVRLTGAVDGTFAVTNWIDLDGTTHLKA